MTVVLGWADGTTVHMMSDSSIVNQYTIDRLGGSKVQLLFEEDDTIMYGSCGSFAISQVLECDNFNIVPFWTWMMDHPKGTPRGYLIDVFARELRPLLKANGMLDNENLMQDGTSFLIGFRGKLFVLGLDFGVLEYPPGSYHAVGVGKEVAYGAMFAQKGDIKQIMTVAMEAAAYHVQGVCGPFYHHTLDLKLGEAVDE